MYKEPSQEPQVIATSLKHKHRSSCFPTNLTSQFTFLSECHFFFYIIRIPIHGLYRLKMRCWRMCVGTVSVHLTQPTGFTNKMKFKEHANLQVWVLPSALQADERLFSSLLAVLFLLAVLYQTAVAKAYFSWLFLSDCVGSQQVRQTFKDAKTPSQEVLYCWVT